GLRGQGPRKLMRFHRFTAAMLALSFAAAAAARAPETWTLTTADFKNASVNVKGIDDKGVRVTDPVTSSDRVVSMDEFLQLERPVASAPGTAPAQQQPGKFVLHLAGGD